MSRIALLAVVISLATCAGSSTHSSQPTRAQIAGCGVVNLLFDAETLGLISAECGGSA